jgi:FecR protein
MRNGYSSRLLGWMLVAFVGGFVGAAHAGGVFDSVTGNVTVIAPNGSRSAAQRFAAIPSGSVISTGDGAQAVLRFDDQSAVVLNQNTDFRVVDFNYEPTKPDASRSVFDFLKGAARFVTGLIARAEPANYKLRAAQATIGVRGTDFDLVSGSLYLSVANGAVTATNAAGTVAFGAGQAGFIGSSGVLPVVILPAQIPAGVASSIARLGAVPLPAGTLPPAPAGSFATGAGGATGSAATAGSTATVIGIGAAAALGAAALSHHTEETTTHH